MDANPLADLPHITWYAKLVHPDGREESVHVRMDIDTDGRHMNYTPIPPDQERMCPLCGRRVTVRGRDDHYRCGACGSSGNWAQNYNAAQP